MNFELTLSMAKRSSADNVLNFRMSIAQRMSRIVCVVSACVVCVCVCVKERVYSVVVVYGCVKLIMCGSVCFCVSVCMCVCCLDCCLWGGFARVRGQTDQSKEERERGRKRCTGSSKRREVYYIYDKDRVREKRKEQKRLNGYSEIKEFCTAKRGRSRENGHHPQREAKVIHHQNPPKLMFAHTNLIAVTGRVVAFEMPIAIFGTASKHGTKKLYAHRKLSS